MDTLTWVLVGILGYWLVLITLRRNGMLPEYVGVQGPIITLHTRRGREFLDRMSRPKRFWRAWGNFGIGIALVVMVGSLVFVILGAISSLYSPEPSAVTEPRNVVVIPGVNDFLPLSVAPEIVFGLVVGLVVHEGGHGLLCRVEDIDIESMGLALIAFIPLGAFVEPDHESQQRTDRGARTRMFAAGVTNNFAVTIVAFLLLFGPVVGAIAIAPGAAVGGAFPGSAAADAGIGVGDRITAIDGTPVPDNDALSAVLSENDNSTVEVTIDGDRTLTVERSLLVVGAPIGGGPAGLETNTTITAINDTPIHTEAGFNDALVDREVVRVSFEADDGETHETTFPAGAYVPQVLEDRPLADAGVPTDAEIVIVGVDDERTTTREQLSTFLGNTDPGQEITVRAYVDGEPGTYDVVLDEHPSGHGAMGVLIADGVSGLTVSDFGTQTYPSDLYLTLLGGGEDDLALGPLTTDSFFGKVVIALFLPIAGEVGMLPFNFPGFTDFITNFYTVEGPLSILGATGVFLLANALFWTAWINLNLGFFNCIPAFPLDGGHILRASTEAITSRLPTTKAYQLTKTVTIGVGLTMLLSLILMIFGQGLLAG